MFFNKIMKEYPYMSKHENGGCGCHTNEETDGTSSGCGCHDKTSSTSGSCDSGSCGCGSSEDENESSPDLELSSCESGSCSCPAKKNQYTIELVLDDAEPIACPILAIFDINEQAYIALNHPKFNRQLLYRYYEHPDSVSLDVIDGEEFDLVSKTFISIMS
jgi:hypothetical protein